MLEIYVKEKNIVKIFLYNNIGSIIFFIEPSVEKVVVSSKVAKIQKRKEKCSICMGEENQLAKSIRLDCGHVFDTNCILHWLSKNHTCPICRSNLLP